MCLRAISQASMGFQAVGGMAEEAAGLVQALEQGLPVDPHSQQAFAFLGDAHVADLVQGARHRHGGRGFAGADTEHPVFQAGTAGVVDQRHLALRIAGVALLGLPLQVELALFVELREVAVPVLGIAEFGVAVEELFDAVLQSGVHGVTSFARRARRSRPSRRKRRQCACWLT